MPKASLTVILHLKRTTYGYDCTLVCENFPERISTNEPHASLISQQFSPLRPEVTRTALSYTSRFPFFFNDELELKFTTKEKADIYSDPLIKREFRLIAKEIGIVRRYVKDFKVLVDIDGESVPILADKE